MWAQWSVVFMCESKYWSDRWAGLTWYGYVSLQWMAGSLDGWVSGYLSLCVSCHMWPILSAHKKKWWETGSVSMILLSEWLTSQTCIVLFTTSVKSVLTRIFWLALNKTNNFMCAVFCRLFSVVLWELHLPGGPTRHGGRHRQCPVFHLQPLYLDMCCHLPQLTGW